MIRSSRPLVALDLGTSKILALVAERDESRDCWRILASSEVPSKGMRRGSVVHLESVIESIKKVMTDVQCHFSEPLRSVTTGIAGGHIASFNSRGVAPIEDREVTNSDISRVLDAAKAIAIPPDHKILHVLPQYFSVDQQTAVRDPLGMFGVRLEAQAHIVTGSLPATQNVVRCIERAGLEVNDIILQPLASSLAVLTDHEKEFGSVLIDIGAGTTDLAVFSEGVMRHSAVLPLGGDQATHDVAVALRIATTQAEALKCSKGSVALESVTSSDFLEASLDMPSSRRISSRALAEVLAARYEELLLLLRQELSRSGFSQSLPSGIIITGGGSLVPGLVGLAERVFEAPVRLGRPAAVFIQDTMELPKASWSTAMGLLEYAKMLQHVEGGSRVSRKEAFSASKKILERMRRWWINHF